MVVYIQYHIVVIHHYHAYYDYNDLMDLINKCEKGDRIVALRMSRIARSMKTLCDFFSACEEKGVLVDIIHEQFDT